MNVQQIIYRVFLKDILIRKMCFAELARDFLKLKQESNKLAHSS